jgi:L-asparaginase
MGCDMPIDVVEHTNRNSYILVLGMGGTISGVSQNADNPLQYRAGKVSVQSLLERVSLDFLGETLVVSKQVANIDSQNLTDEDLRKLGRLVVQSLDDPLLKGIVITHGTDTIEEVGIFLHLTCGNKALNVSKRIVLTGAMLPSNALLSDGPQNLTDALKWVSSEFDEYPGGVYGVFAGKVCMGQDLSKRHATDLDAPVQSAQSSSIKALGPSWLSMVKSIQLSSELDLPIPESGAWPWVEILTSHAGARPETLQTWLGSGVQGLVIAGTGLGGFHSAWLPGVKFAVHKGVALVRSSRTGAGLVSKNIPKREIDGMAPSGNLSAPKARIALQLALNAVRQTPGESMSKTWQDIFVKISYRHHNPKVSEKSEN